MELKDRIALARKQAGLSQEQLGDQLGVSRQAVSKWEAGQANPDVTYVAAMCRLFGVSSDWLLLGEENALSAAPARCPGCQAIVTGLDRFCPSCGRNLRSGAQPLITSYTLVLKGAQNPGELNGAADLIRLSNSGCFSEDSPLAQPLQYEEAERLTASAPLILGTGLSREQACELLDRCIYSNAFLVLQDSEETDPQVLASQPGFSLSVLRPKQREPLSFGMVVLAVVLGVAGAIFLLSFL